MIDREKQKNAMMLLEMAAEQLSGMPSNEKIIAEPSELIWAAHQLVQAMLGGPEPQDFAPELLARISAVIAIEDAQRKRP